MNCDAHVILEVIIFSSECCDVFKGVRSVSTCYIYMVRYPDIYKPDIGLGIRNTFLAKQNTPIV